MDEISDDQFAQNQTEDPSNFLIGDQDQQSQQIQKPQKQILKQKSQIPIPVTKQIQKTQPVQNKVQQQQGKFNLQQYRQNKLLQKQNTTPVQKKQVKQIKPPSKSKHRQWDPSWKIISLQKPELLTHAQSTTKRYVIAFQYIKANDIKKKRYQASIRFGLRKANYCIDSQEDDDPTQQLLRQQINFVKKVSFNPFVRQFWELHLLNNPECPTLESAFINFQQKVIFRK